MKLKNLRKQKKQRETMCQKRIMKNLKKYLNLNKILMSDSNIFIISRKKKIEHYAQYKEKYQLLFKQVKDFVEEVKSTVYQEFKKLGFKKKKGSEDDEDSEKSESENENSDQDDSEKEEQNMKVINQ